MAAPPDHQRNRTVAGKAQWVRGSWRDFLRADVGGVAGSGRQKRECPVNSGIQDAHNLGWKLGLVLAGAATPDLLDTYDEERLPIASWLLNITSERLNAVLVAIKKSGGGVDAVASPELTQLQLGSHFQPRLRPSGHQHLK
jgi:hypothetical protein